MHIPEGFLSGQVTGAGSVIAVAGLAYCVSRADISGDDGRLPLAGLAGAFFLVGDSPFIPIGVGTQGHLLGGTLAVALLGPWLGALTIAVVTILQALVQGDGGITTLGLNIVNAALVPAFIGWPVLRAVQRIVTRLRGSPTAGGLAFACAVAAYLNVLLAAVLFVVEFQIGAKAGIDSKTVAGSTIGVYALVGIVEAAATAVIVRALLARRPDLVRIAPPELRPVRRRRATPRASGTSVPPPTGSEPKRTPRVPPPPGCEPKRTPADHGRPGPSPTDVPHPTPEGSA